MYSYKYPRPALTTDAVLWGIVPGDEQVYILLIRRKNDPFKGHFALPGGFVDQDESAEHCVVRELEEETGLKDIPLVQMRTFSAPGRDPRGHTVSVVFFAMIDKNKYKPQAGDDAAIAQWVSLNDIAKQKIDRHSTQTDDIVRLAFDHQDIVAYSALFVFRNVFLSSDYHSPNAIFHPFAEILEHSDKQALKQTCLLYSDEFNKFRNK